MAYLSAYLPRPRCRIMRWLYRAWLWAVLAGLAAAAETGDGAGIAGQVKAAYLYKFGNYVEWPASVVPHDGPLTIGILGDEALADELLKIAAGRTINGRSVSVRKLRRDAAMSGNHILFVGMSHADELADILATVKGLPVLVVTDSEQGLAAGSMINFVVVDGKLRFEVAPKVAGKGNLLISARLLAVAYRVLM